MLQTGSATCACSPSASRRSCSPTCFGLVGSTVVGLVLLFVAAGIGIGLVETAEHAGALWTLGSPRLAFLYLAGCMLASLGALGLTRRPQAGSTT